MSPLSKDSTSVDFLACAKDHRGKGVGASLADSVEGPQKTDARLFAAARNRQFMEEQKLRFGGEGGAFYVAGAAFYG